MGTPRGDINGSEYLKEIFSSTGNDTPYFDIDDEKRLQDCCLELIRKGLLGSAHDISEGGLAIALIESVITGENAALGCKVKLPRSWNWRKDFLLFGEEQSRIVISSRSHHRSRIQEISRRYGVDFSLLGNVTSSQRIVIEGLISMERGVAERVYFDSIGQVMDRQS